MGLPERHSPRPGELGRRLENPLPIGVLQGNGIAGCVSICRVVERRRASGRAFCPGCGQKYAVPEDELRRRPGVRFRAVCRSCDTAFSVRWSGDQLVTEAEEVLADSNGDERDVLPKGARIGKYEIEEMLATGGSSTVYRAFEAGANRTVALKVLHREGDVDYGIRFRREVEVQGNLKHQNVMPIFDQGTVDGKPFYTMELLHKPTTLETIVQLWRNGRLGYNPSLRTLNSLEALLRRVFLPIARAIDFANSHGVIHRDLKPGNVLIDARTLRVFIIDFGICHTYRSAGRRLVLRGDEPGSDEEKRRMTMGTVRFMPPEQARGDVSPQGDVWALGALLHFFFAGEAPIASAIDLKRVPLDKRLANLEKLAASSRQHGDEEEARFYEARMVELQQGTQRTLRDVVKDAQEGNYLPLPPDVPPPLAAVVHRAMQKHPRDRYPSAEEMAQEIDRWLEGRPVRAYAHSLPAPAATFYQLRLLARRNRPAVIAAIAVVVIAIGFGGWEIWRKGAEQRERIEAMLLQARQAKDPATQVEKLEALLEVQPDNAEAHRLIARAREYANALERLRQAREVRARVESLVKSGQDAAARQIAEDMAAVLEGTLLPDLRALPPEHPAAKLEREVNDIASYLRGRGLVTVTGVPSGIEIAIIGQRSPETVEAAWDAPDVWGVTPLLITSKSLKAGSYILRMRRPTATGGLFLPFRVPPFSRAAIEITCPLNPAQLPEGMVYVGGAENMVLGDPLFQEHIERVSIAPFFIDRTEVTNSQYARYLAALPSGNRARAVPRRLLPGPGDRTAPLWIGSDDGRWEYPAGTGDEPVTGITLADAREFAAWAGKRLPTPQEWELAARGLDARAFPFGNELDPAACNTATSAIADVASFPRDRSPWGAFDMAGNVAEWVESGTGPLADVKGGSFEQPRYRAMAASVERRRSTQPYTDVGFRCARDVR